MLELDLNPCLPSSKAIALHTPRDLPATMGRRGALWVALVLPQEPGPASLHLHVLHSRKGLAASRCSSASPWGRAGPGRADAACCSVLKGRRCHCASQEQASWKEELNLPPWRSSSRGCLRLSPAGVRTRERSGQEG